MGPKVAVVGLGTMGAQCLWQLSRRGIDASGYETTHPVTAVARRAATTGCSA